MIPEFSGKEFNNDMRVSLGCRLYSQIGMVKYPMRQINFHMRRASWFIIGRDQKRNSRYINHQEGYIYN